MLKHIAITSSCEANLAFYQKLGFIEQRRFPLGPVTVVYLSNGDEILEIFLDPNRKSREGAPELYGLLHFCLEVPDIEKAHADLAELNPGDIQPDWLGNKLFFVVDPDGQPVEIMQNCE